MHYSNGDRLSVVRTRSLVQGKGAATGERRHYWVLQGLMQGGRGAKAMPECE